MPALRVLGASLCAAACLSAVTASPALASTPRTPLPTGVTAKQWVRVQLLSRQLKVLRSCESSGNYKSNTGNGYYGAYQFSAATWQSLGRKDLPHKATPAIQDATAVKLRDRRGSWDDWGKCGGKAAAVKVKVKTKH